MPTTLILGAGVFGASTAYHLAKSSPPSPDNRIILLDRTPLPTRGSPPPTSPAASWDWNKCIRGDYDDAVYTRIMLDCMEAWRGQAPWKPFYFQTGALWMAPHEMIKSITDNYIETGGKLPEGSKLMTREEAVAGGHFPDADMSAYKDVFWTPKSGWGKAKEALAATLVEAVEMGVESVTGEVDSLSREEADEEGEGKGNDDPKPAGRCVGVLLRDGRQIKADRVVVCLGAGAIRLLESSGEDLAVGDRLRALGIPSACILGGLEPVGPYKETVGIWHRTDSMGGGYMPAGPGSPAKFWHDSLLCRTVTHPRSGNRVSMPPPKEHYDMWNVSDNFKDLFRKLAVSFFGPENGARLELGNWRMCWDLSTSNQDFVVSPLGRPGRPVQGLYMATAGSYHGYKFLPVIGRYVVDMLEGRLERELADKWDWNAERSEVFWKPKQEVADFGFSLGGEEGEGEGKGKGEKVEMLLATEGKVGG